MLLLSLVALLGCVEEVELGIVSNERTRGILIVEATLTDEQKNHRLTLSRMDTIIDLKIDSIYNPNTPIRDINRDLVLYERNADVSITEASGPTYSFVEISPGVYESSEVFSARTGSAYQLNITTQDGGIYVSKPTQVEGLANISSMYAEKTISNSGEEGIGIFVDANTLEGNVKNLRYTYDETYKIVAPFWVEDDFRLTDYDPCALPVPTYNLEIVPREEEQKVCYGNALSNTIIQTQQTNENDQGLNKFMVRFLSKENYIISHRYSIEVEQLVTSTESYSFYEQLNNFSQTGSVFSQVQPGFLVGNLSSKDGREGSVIGFFDVVSVSKKRLFFNYEDIYPNEELPLYPFNCSEQSAPESHRSFCAPSSGGGCPQSVIERVNLNLISYVRNNDGGAVGSCPGPHVFVAKVCGDCTLLGSNKVPEFWTE